MTDAWVRLQREQPQDAALMDLFEDASSGLLEEPVKNALAARLLRLTELERDAATLLEAFERGVFVRDIDGDGTPGWRIKVMPYLAAMARISVALAGQEGELGATPEEEPDS